MPSYFYFFIFYQLSTVGLGLYFSHIDKSSGRRLLHGPQLAKYQWRLMAPSYFFLPIFALWVLWQSRYALLNWRSSQPGLTDMLGGPLLIFCIGPIITEYLRSRKTKRNIHVLNIPEKEVVAALRVALEDCGFTDALLADKYTSYKIEIPDGAINVGTNKKTYYNLSVDVKPDDRMLEIRDCITKNLRERLKPVAETAPPSVRFSLRTLLLATFTLGGLMGLSSELQPWFKVTEWRPHKLECSRIQYSADGKKLLTQSLSGKPEAAIWDAQSLTKIADLPTGFTCDAVFSSDGKLVALGGTSVVVCDAATGKVIKEFAGQQANALAFSPDGIILAIGSSDKTVKLWNFEFDRNRYVFTEAAEVMAVTYSPQGDYILTGISNGDLEFWQSGSGTKTWNANWPGAKWNSVSYSSDGKHQLTAGVYPYFISMTSNQISPPASYYFDNDIIQFAQFSPDGTHILSCGSQIKLWERDTQNKEELFPGYTRACFHPDGLHIVTAGADTAAIWERRTSGEWWSFIKLPTFWIAFVAFCGLVLCFYSDVKAMKAAALAEVK